MSPVIFTAVPFEKPNADALIEFHRLFNFRGAHMLCRSCGRGLPITEDGKLLPHALDCRTAGEQHPWARLRALLAGELPEGQTP